MANYRDHPPGPDPISADAQRAMRAIEEALRTTTRDADRRLRRTGRGAVTVHEPVLRLNGQPPEVTVRGPHGFLNLRVDQDTGQRSLHLITPGFPQHALPDPIDTQLGNGTAAAVINVPEADLEHAVRAAAPVLEHAQEELNRTRERIEHEAGVLTVTRDGITHLEPGSPGIHLSTAYAHRAEHDATAAIDAAASTPTLADDGDASAARVAAMGARAASVSQASGSLGAQHAASVAVATSAVTRQRLREVHHVVDHVAAQRIRPGVAPAGPAQPQTAARSTDPTDYPAPRFNQDGPTAGQR